MKMSSLIEKTMAAKAAVKASKTKDGYRTVLSILSNDLQGAEMLPGAVLKMTVAAVVGDEFDNAVKDIGNDVLTIGNVRIWRSTTSRGIINAEGIRPGNIDEDWDDLIEAIKDRSEMI